MNVDRTAERVLEEHMLVGPRTGQCSCGFGGPERPYTARELRRPHARHVVQELRVAGVLAARGSMEWYDGDRPSIAPTELEFPRVLDMPLTEETLLGQVRLPVCKVGGSTSATRGSVHFADPKEGVAATEVEVTVRFHPGDGGVLNVSLEYL